MTQTLTLAVVKSAARRFYDKGKLTAQHPDQMSRECRYEAPGGYRCAIGAAMSSQTLAAIGNVYQNTGIAYLVEQYGMVALKMGDEKKIGVIQVAHDGWCNESQRYGDRTRKSKKAKAKFLRAIRA